MSLLNHKTMEEKNIDSLRKFFAISVAVFEMQRTISIAFGYSGNKSRMHELHLIAKEEIDKQAPDLMVIDRLLTLMEYETIQNSNT